MVPGMTPELFYTVFSTASGWVGLLGLKTGLLRTTLPQSTERDVEDLLSTNDFSAVPSDHFYRDLIQRIRKYYEGYPVDFPDKLDLSGATAFQRSVWQATRSIPYGETRSYGWVAGQIGKPGASRAVGQALHLNPLPLVIPCHRVIGSNGKLVGFGGGVEMKSYLLALEMTGEFR